MSLKMLDIRCVFVNVRVSKIFLKTLLEKYQQSRTYSDMQNFLSGSIF